MVSTHDPVAYPHGAERVLLRADLSSVTDPDPQKAPHRLRKQNTDHL